MWKSFVKHQKEVSKSYKKATTEQKVIIWSGWILLLTFMVSLLAYVVCA